MSKEVLVFLLGVVVCILPFLGVPSDIKERLLVGIGALLILLGYLLRRAAFLRHIRRANGERHANTFVEQSPNDT